MHLHIWETYVEEAEHLRHSYDIKQIYAKRKETIERVFTDAKEKDGNAMDNLKRSQNLSMQALLFCCHVFEETRYVDMSRNTNNVSSVRKRH
ncbi:hypothetical protein FOH38_21195 [Lysinibacillus fusiformis]|nr:hypothetical protein FOH38_21195 [Lysinibacillus fusiformis]